MVAKAKKYTQKNAILFANILELHTAPNTQENQICLHYVYKLDETNESGVEECSVILF